MKTITTLATAFALSLAVPGFALADSHHGHGAPDVSQDDASLTGSQPEMMQMMQMMMMRQHGQMMGRTMMEAGSDGGTAMMDGAIMRMMMGPGMMGDPSPEIAHETMLKRLAEFDSDKDGSLSLTEFEALNATMIRESMVDRFQYLDADGDGRITEIEMVAPARRMEMQGMKMSGAMPDPSGMTGGQAPSNNRRPSR